MKSESLRTSRIAPARMADVDRIHQLITHWAERHLMLFRGLEELYEHIRDFRVYVDENDNDNVLGCCSLEVVWRDLGEIKSLAVDPDHRGGGIGRALVSDALAEADRLGLSKVFALTFEVAFFENLHFERVAKDTLPHKVWTDCIRCPMQNDCREEPVLIELPGDPPLRG